MSHMKIMKCTHKNYHQIQKLVLQKLSGFRNPKKMRNLSYHNPIVLNNPLGIERGSDLIALQAQDPLDHHPLRVVRRPNQDDVTVGDLT